MCTERKATGYYVLAWFMFATMNEELDRLKAIDQPLINLPQVKMMNTLSQ